MTALPPQGPPLPAAKPVLSRFTIILLACVLTGMSFGSRMTPQSAAQCGLAGLLAFACYLALELAAYYQRRHWSHVQKASAEQRLSAHTHTVRNWDLDEIGWHAPSGLGLGLARVSAPVHAARWR